MEDILFSMTGHVAEVTINRPHKGNALNAAVRRGLFEAFDQANAAADCRVIILTAAGDRVFCAGADLVEMANEGITVPPKDYLPVLGRNVQVDKPVIAAVNGAALAGGFLLAQMCDLIVASRSSSFAITEARRGRGSPWAIPLTKQLPRRVMTELLVTAEPMSAQRAYELGFVNALAEPDDLLRCARGIAATIARNAPLTVKANLRMMRFADEMGVQAAELVAEEIFREVYLSEDAREGPLAFKEKREPVWKGR